MKGRIISVGRVGHQLAEVWLWSELLDMACAALLNMEGERCGRDIFFKPSALQTVLL